MIDLVTIGSYAASAVLPLVAVKVYSSRKSIQKYFKVLFSSSTVVITPEKEYPDLGMVTYDIVIEETDSEFTTRLETIYKDEWKEYLEYNKNKPLDTLYDRLLLIALVKAANENDNGIVNVSDYHLDFDNGIRVWTANRWYAFGHLHRVDGRLSNRGVTASSSVKLSNYTWLRLVDLYMEHRFFDDWKERHDKYTNNALSSRKRK